MWGFLSLLVALVGVLMYALSTNPKLEKIGIVSYGAGLLAFLLQNGERIVNLTGR